MRSMPEGQDAAMGFYEDDEPTEKVVEDFERGEKGVTAPPGDVTWQSTAWPDLPWSVTMSDNTTCSPGVRADRIHAPS